MRGRVCLQQTLASVSKQRLLTKTGVFMSVKVQTQISCPRIIHHSEIARHRYLWSGVNGLPLNDPCLLASTLVARESGTSLATPIMAGLPLMPFDLESLGSEIVEYGYSMEDIASATQLLGLSISPTLFDLETAIFLLKIRIPRHGVSLQSWGLRVDSSLPDDRCPHVLPAFLSPPVDRERVPSFLSGGDVLFHALDIDPNFTDDEKIELLKDVGGE